MRIGQAVKPIRERTAELMQSGVGEFHLGLDAGNPGDTATGRARRGGSDRGVIAILMNRRHPMINSDVRTVDRFAVKARPASRLSKVAVGLVQVALAVQCIAAERVQSLS